MADGYSQVYNNRRCAHLHLRGRTRGMDNIPRRFIGCRDNTFGRALARQGQKERRINMGALVMFGLVSIIAIVGVIYFNRRDKKNSASNSSL